MTTPAIDGGAVASNAMNYVGHAYSMGGAPGPQGNNPWDCSSAVSWWLGHDFGMRLPGSKNPGYDGSSHGPGSWQYITWSGAQTVGSPQAGDLIIWPGMGAQGHIGIAISGTDMVSALNPALGTRKTPILATKPGIHMVRRLTGAANTTSLTGCVPGMMIAYWLISQVRERKDNDNHNPQDRISAAAYRSRRRNARER